MWFLRKLPWTQSLEASNSLPRPKKRNIWGLTALLTFTAVISFVIIGFLSQKWARSSDCQNPPRRREWRQLNNAEKTEYISAVKCMHDQPSRITGQGRLSDDFPWVHKRIGEITHYAAPFFPWHRYFIFLYEKTLREACGFRGQMPYWDWSLDWEDPTKSPIWDPHTGFGGDGTSGGDSSVRWGTCIANGPFVDYEVHWYNRTARPHCLSRGFGRQEYPSVFNGSDLSPSSISKILAKDKYSDFLMGIETGPHNTIPMNINGDFMLFEAPNDPIFFLHHTQADRLWWTWQKQSAERSIEYNGKKQGDSNLPASLDDILPMHGLGPDLPVRDLMKTDSGLFCYTY